MSIIPHKSKKNSILVANKIDMRLEQPNEDVPPLIGLRISQDEKNSVIVVLTPEEASKLVNNLLKDDVKMFLNLSDERKDVMYA